MKSTPVIVFLVIFTLSAEAASLSYHQYYDDDYTEEGADEDLGADMEHPQPPSHYEDDQDYYVEEEEEEGLRKESMRRDVLPREEGGEFAVEEEEEEMMPDEEEYRSASSRTRESVSDYDEVEGKFPRRVYDEVSPPTSPTHDPLADAQRQIEEAANLKSARSMAVLHVMDKLLKVLGENFGENLPKAPTNSALATVATPMNITAEPCPYKYKRCSSQTSFPSCNVPHNADPEAWSQRFNLYFNLTVDVDKMDIINATLRLYKNNSIPLHYPKLLLIKAYAYTRSLTKRRSRTMLVTETSVSSDYIGWVTLPMDKVVRRWRKVRNNHGLLITVTDADTIPWDAASIFVIMSCTSGNNNLVALPFEVQTDEIGQRYPGLNIRQGSPGDEFPMPSMSRVMSSPRPALPMESMSRYIQSDDPYVYDDEEDIPQTPSPRQSNAGHHSSTTHNNNYPHGTEGHQTIPHSNYPFSTGSRRTVHNNYPYGTDLIREEATQGHGHSLRGGHERITSGSSSHETSYPHGAPHHEITSDYLFTNEATHTRHAINPHYGGSALHHRNPDHSMQGALEHPLNSRVFSTEPTIEHTMPSHISEEQLSHSERMSHREPIPTTETTRPHRQRDGSTKERRHRRKHHHQRHGSTPATL